MLDDLLKKSIDRFKLASELSLQKYNKPIIIEYSGGKDSDAILRIAEISGIPYTLHHSLTTADPPQVVQHVKDVFRKQEMKSIKTEIDYHVQEDGSRLTMWNLIPKKLMPPTRRVRYCCSSLKETGNKDSVIITGVRWAESKKRSARSQFEALANTQKNSIGISDEKMLITDNEDTRRFFEKCDMKAKIAVNPIIDFSDKYLWDFLKDEKVETCDLYKSGYDRLGCIGCPLASKKRREKEFYDFPKYKQAYIKAFDRMIEQRNKKGKKTQWSCGDEVFHWWIGDDNIYGQLTIDDYLKALDE